MMEILKTRPPFFLSAIKGESIFFCCDFIFALPPFSFYRSSSDTNDPSLNRILLQISTGQNGIPVLLLEVLFQKQEILLT